MNNRVTHDSANTVSLFPFLAVLLCTMGALLVLLVVLAQRAGQRVIAKAEQPVVEPAKFQAASVQQPVVDADETAELKSQLEELREYQRALANLRKQAEQRLDEEKQRLTHLEEHTRRLEHELAKLSLAVEQLKATEADRTVDQDQAEKELARLQQLIKDRQDELDDLREQKNGKRSYAIVPYRGPNGTYRKPVYIECRKDSIVLQPEGIRIEPQDLPPIGWPGNPLAAALRATRDHVNAQAAKAGAPEPPDPYPVILVRPDGIQQYALARRAITSWDASFGYEFIDADWNLEFPEGIDPALAQKQEHAIFLARERLAQLIRSAPRRFEGIAIGGTTAAAYGGRPGGSGYGEGNANAGYGSSSQREQSQFDGIGQGNAGYGTGQTGSSGAGELTASGATGEKQFGAMSGDGAHGQGVADSSNGDLAAYQDLSRTAEGGTAPGNNGLGERYSSADGSAGAAGSKQTNSGLAGSGSGSAEGSSNGAAGGGPAFGSSSSGGAAGGGGSPSLGGSSIADSRGQNWAVQGRSRGAVAIRRSIQIVVREDQIALLPSRHVTQGDAATGKVISLAQSPSQISEELVSALRTRINEWGLAGSGLYWRPVLKLSVGPGAEQTAQQILQLLDNSGVEVNLPETARVPTKGALDATH